MGAKPSIAGPAECRQIKARWLEFLLPVFVAAACSGGVPSTTKSASIATSATTAFATQTSLQPSALPPGTFLSVRGWIAVGGRRIVAIDPDHPSRRKVIFPDQGLPVTWSRDGSELLIQTGAWPNYAYEVLWSDELSFLPPGKS